MPESGSTDRVCNRNSTAPRSAPCPGNRPGEYQLTVRATDRKGEVQAKDEKRPKTSGETGMYKITVQLAA